MCAIDLNGNGQIDQGETATCTGDAGTLCPLDAVACAPAQTPPTCPTGGSYVPADDRCEAASWTCSLNGSVYNSNGACVTACSETSACTSNAGGYVCPYGASYTCDAKNNCTRAGSCTQGKCASGYTVTSGICAAAVACSAGSYSSTAKACVNPATTVCPHGSSYPCVSTKGTFECSTATCINPSTAQTTTVNTSMLQNNGARDTSGNCLGTIYIFSGRMMTCNKAGQESGWKNCCQSGQATIADDVGSAENLYSASSAISTVYQLGEIAYYGSQFATVVATSTPQVAAAVYASYGASGLGLPTSVLSSISVVGNTVTAGGTASAGIMAGMQTYMTSMLLNPTTWIIAGAMYAVQKLLLSGSCSQEDVETAMLDASGMCHDLGSYCAEKWPIVGCVQKSEAFCCFNSMLARIIQEQGRPQLKSFSPNPWGVASGDGPPDADCRGFTSAEFQMLDFSNMNLSEYFGQIQTQVQSSIRQNISDKITNYYNSTVTTPP